MQKNELSEAWKDAKEGGEAGKREMIEGIDYSIKKCKGGVSIIYHRKKTAEYLTVREWF